MTNVGIAPLQTSYNLLCDIARPSSNSIQTANFVHLII